MAVKVLYSVQGFLCIWWHNYTNEINSIFHDFFANKIMIVPEKTEYAIYIAYCGALICPHIRNVSVV